MGSNFINSKQDNMKKKQIKHLIKFISTLFLLNLLFVSCNTEKYVAAQKLFSISFGDLPGDFNPWTEPIGGYQRSFGLRNGIFYIGNINKLMAFSSTGVLLEFIAPASAYQNGIFELYNNSNIPYYVYPLENIGPIGISKDNTVFFAHILHSDEFRSYFFDSSPQQTRVQVLSYKNTVEEFIKKERNNEFNFHSIETVHVKNNSEIAILSKIENGAVLYFFDSEGKFLREVVFYDSALPLFSDEDVKEDDTEYTTNRRGLFVTAVPSHFDSYVYLQVRYYEFISDAQDIVLEVKFKQSRVFRIDLFTEQYDKEILVPDNIGESLMLTHVEKNGDLVFLGMDIEGVENNNLSLVKLSNNGSLKNTHVLENPFNDFISFEYSYDGNGKVGAYFVREDKIDVVWWSLK